MLIIIVVSLFGFAPFGQGNPLNLYGEYAFGACVSGNDTLKEEDVTNNNEDDETAPPARCAYYTLVDEPVARLVEEYEWCNATNGGRNLAAAPGRVPLPGEAVPLPKEEIDGRCTGRRGWEYMRNLTLVQWARVRYQWQHAMHKGWIVRE
eukprot:8546358-Pyramimonas_sp.AAC.1